MHDICTGFILYLVYNQYKVHSIAAGSRNQKHLTPGGKYLYIRKLYLYINLVYSWTRWTNWNPEQVGCVFNMLKEEKKSLTPKYNHESTWDGSVTTRLWHCSQQGFTTESTLMFLITSAFTYKTLILFHTAESVVINVGHDHFDHNL